MNGEIKITCNGDRVEAEVYLGHLNYEDRMSLMNVMASIVNFRKEDLLLFLLSFDSIKDAMDETKIDLSNLTDYLRGNTDADN